MRIKYQLLQCGAIIFIQLSFCKNIYGQSKPNPHAYQEWSNEKEAKLSRERAEKGYAPTTKPSSSPSTSISTKSTRLIRKIEAYRTEYRKQEVKDSLAELDRKKIADKETKEKKEVVKEKPAPIIHGDGIQTLKYDDADFRLVSGVELAPANLNDKYGFVDKSGKLIVPLKYLYADPFSEGVALVTNGIKFGFIDTDGREVIPLKYVSARDFKEGLAAVTAFDGKESYLAGFINKADKIIIPLIYKQIDDFSEGLAAVMLKDKWGFLDKTGKLQIQYVYDEVFSGFEEQLAPVCINKKWGFIDTHGNIVIPLQYEKAQPFFLHEASVVHNGKNYKIDKTGKIVSEF
jgi:KWG Leptospira.